MRRGDIEIEQINPSGWSAPQGYGHVVLAAGEVTL